MAVTSAGRIVINLDYLLDSGSLDTLGEVEGPAGGEVFLGIVVPQSRVAEVMKRLDDAAAAAAATVGPQATRRR